VTSQSHSINRRSDSSATLRTEVRGLSLSAAFLWVPMIATNLQMMKSRGCIASLPAMALHQ
jgi:hypothetical protein